MVIRIGLTDVRIIPEAGLNVVDKTKLREQKGSIFTKSSTSHLEKNTNFSYYDLGLGYIMYHSVLNVPDNRFLCDCLHV